MSFLSSLSTPSTEGERNIFAAYLVVALYGAWISFSFVTQINSVSVLANGLSIFEIWVVVSGAIGTVVGVFLSRRWLGFSGLSGMTRALIGFPIASLFCALCVGTLSLPVYGTMFGPLALVSTFATYPVLGLCWFAAWISAHCLFSAYRKERDSIFAIGGRA